MSAEGRIDRGFRRWAVAAGLCLLVAACVTQPTVPARAIVKTVDVETSIELAREISQHDSTLPEENQDWFQVLRGNRPIIVVAPHATRPMREGELRFSDGAGTAALAAALHDLAGATALYTTYASPSDPNYYDDNAFKECLAALVTELKPVIVLDIHGSHPYRPYDVDLGTMNGESLLGRTSLLGRLVKRLKHEGIKNLSKDYFAASKNQTITKWCVRQGVPCIQLEISSTWLDPAKDDLHAHRYAQVLQALDRYITDLTEGTP